MYPPKPNTHASFLRPDRSGWRCARDAIWKFGNIIVNLIFCRVPREYDARKRYPFVVRIPLSVHDVCLLAIHSVENYEYGNMLSLSEREIKPGNKPYPVFYQKKKKVAKRLKKKQYSLYVDSVTHAMPRQNKNHWYRTRWLTKWLVVWIVDD